ncbi:MAG: hypothetical protein ABI559_05415 [Chloroflexota bacterium]
MQSTAFTHTAPTTFQFQTQPTGRNPWVSDHVLLGLSFWWVQNSRSAIQDVRGEVGEVFRSLQHQLQ